MKEITLENKKIYCSEDIVNLPAVDIDKVTVAEKTERTF